MGKPRLAILLATLGLAILLPVIGNGIRRSDDSGCALDGQRIDPAFRVRIQDRHRGIHVFCCIRCAELWLDQQPDETREVLVTDEPSGEEIPAASAFFVRSLAVSMQSTGNRIHVFKQQPAAENYARLFRGTLLRDSERPFANPR